ncbi:hypothetical protein PBCVNY2B_671L [Paramecium bursaria Chlorella virus NY2B]|uniref:Uncharacterized protein n=1 Tax=Paramecium bursaria Chlorella virus NYs1 TaxID=83442 RepID=M1I8J2_9PHYC|nr:hypothetical protein FK949_gp286 [Paramecium bursaria Chlorella virus NYs1]AGE54338.1 hypothetical protein PBCVIL52s1_688L [Paramecium bursaria Chlorella virus IL-5-2s1]AGE55024.1 hypothetical protein PBCVMA1D_675L [Paramecium bursaria Chlorella virus MA1D]AGE58456.1 hypothetical protein PBCVNY2B_671L [Paramecium bursaria Chlorella virus NY2B]AGE58839.1 hypothetical protein PBCVNYs1_679L [Paramecium bursaria Chlorella virus NYs1]
MNYVQNVKTAYVYAKSIFRHLTAAKKQYKCIVFNEDQGSELDFFEYAPIIPIEDLKKIIRLKKYKIEIRYVVHGRKYRIVIRETDNIHFPIRKELGIKKPNIVSASLVRKHTDEDIDVTKRVIKYFGQNNDFSAGLGLRLFVQDMFPFDDHEDNAEIFSALYIRMSDGTEYRFDYGANDEIVLRSPPNLLP